MHLHVALNWDMTKVYCCCVMLSSVGGRGIHCCVSLASLFSPLFFFFCPTSHSSALWLQHGGEINKGGLDSLALKHMLAVAHAHTQKMMCVVPVGMQWGAVRYAWQCTNSYKEVWDTTRRGCGDGKGGTRNYGSGEMNYFFSSLPKWQRKQKSFLRLKIQKSEQHKSRWLLRLDSRFSSQCMNLHLLKAFLKYLYCSVNCI